VRLVLLGDPIDHSRSPAIHRAAMDAVGIEGDYTALRSDEAGVVDTCERIRRGDLTGANVTMPLKRAASRLSDRLSAEARRLEAVNTLVGGDGAVEGHNTDVIGLRSVLERFPADMPVVVLGAGSSAAAAVMAAERGERVVVVARRLEQAEALIARVGVEASAAPWDAIPPGGIVVNATPLGMRGERLPDGALPGRDGLIDLPYGERVTPAVEEGRRSGIEVVDGLDVLVAQAAASFELWTGIEAPVDVMERAARTPIGR
jgi:shikimate dehydrogenase